MSSRISSWGRAHLQPQTHQAFGNRHAGLPEAGDKGTLLAHGNGRSYGDSNLNSSGLVLHARHLDRFIDFNPDTGLLRCEAGVLLAEILELVVPQGWFLPVTPGTKYVTVGGAIANDVHGKNHHVVGSFGNHVQFFELLRSDGSRLLCSPADNAVLYAATIGGLGLTGLITWAEIQLKRIANPYVDNETIRFRHLEDFFEISERSAADYEYTVAWIDCAFSGKRLGRGLFNRANHAPVSFRAGRTYPLTGGWTHERERRVPLTPPISLINPLSLKAFNLLYFNKQWGDEVRGTSHLDPFFYPLDALLEWNRIYGPRGFYQYQCVLPPDGALEGTRSLLQAISRSGMGSFLAVLKQFGEPASRGMLSFPTPGTTLALDFPNQGERLHALFRELDAVVSDHGGRLYPAKDGRMSREMFAQGHPRLAEFLPWVDPAFSSDFWQRVRPVP